MEKKGRGRPTTSPDGIPLTAKQRQMAYRKKKLKEGIEISIFLTNAQADILRDKAKAEGKTQSEYIGELLEKPI